MSGVYDQDTDRTLEALVTLFRSQGDRGAGIAQFITACESRGEDAAFVAVREAMEYAELHNPS